ncbi:MAG: hypothetical protein FWH27_16590, partial [Planctomycetaceae bacterium]|nr:hypothetical protein [Planctomycetaceae bacterium]
LQLTKVVVTLVTPLYMSPEQAEAKPLDHRSDIYSLGITGYHMLAGHPPFRGDTALSVALQHLKKEAEMLETVRPDIPPAMARIVHRMMAKSPGDRFHSVRQLKLEMKQLHTKFFSNTEFSETLADWEALPLDVVDLSLNALTDKLQATMVFETGLAKKRRRLWPVLLIGCLLFFVGAVVGGQQDKPEKVLGFEGQSLEEIPEQQSVYAQWALATQLQTPRAWKSVISWNDPQMTVMAKQQIAWYYYRNRMPEQAKDWFSDLAGLPPSSYADLVRFGRAGLAWVAKMMGNVNEYNLYYKEVIADHNSNPNRPDSMAWVIIENLLQEEGN